MGSVQEHYQNFLASHYTWMSGGFDQKVAENRRFFESVMGHADARRTALDLGCGSGFQALALTSLGFSVVAVDTSEQLINELRDRSADQQITALIADLRNSDRYAPYGPFDLAVCMGDTLVHLSSFDDVSVFIKAVRSQLKHGGTLVLSFRDLTTELVGIDRAIPVRLDDDRLMATFLEYEPDHVVVNDMLFVRDGARWDMRKSAYKKLRLAPKRVIDLLEEIGFRLVEHRIDRGFSTIIAKS